MESILTIKDIFMVVSFVGGLIGIYIKHQIDFTRFKTDTDRRMQQYEKELNKLQNNLDKQTAIQQELLLESKEQKVVLQQVVSLLNELRVKFDTYTLK
jgi:beta-phosphoglucomutase-like phosphatase (HAD superfamily)